MDQCVSAHECSYNCGRDQNNYVCETLGDVALWIKALTIDVVLPQIYVFVVRPLATCHCDTILLVTKHAAASLPLRSGRRGW